MKFLKKFFSDECMNLLFGFLYQCQWLKEICTSWSSILFFELFTNGYFERVEPLCINCSISDDQKKGNSNSINYGTPTELFINYYEYLELDECKPGLDAWSDIPILTPTKPPQTQGLYQIIPKMKRKLFII